MSEKLTAKEYAEKLLYTPEYAADKQADVKEKAAAFAEGYKKFMDSAKTEREAAVVSEQMLLAAGYKAFEPKKAYAPGEKVYFIQENKAETMERLLWRLPSARSPMKRASVWSSPTSTAPVWTCVPTPCMSLTT